MEEEQNNPPAPEETEEPKTIPGDPKNEEETTLGQKEFHTNIQGDVKVSGSGDNATYNYFEIHGQTDEQIRQQIREEVKAQFGEKEDEDSPDTPLNQKKATGRGRRFKKKIDDDISFTENEDDPTIKEADLPKTDADLARWYHKLSLYDKCFVQAMAIFDGASVPEVAYATGRLYEPLQQIVVATITQQSPTSARLAMPDDVSLDERLAHTHTKKHRVSRGTHIFWQDADTHGTSQFKLRVLHFIAEEVHLWHGSAFLERLETWAEKLTDENGPRAIHALGAIWWHQANRLHRIANSWTLDERWYRAAYLLDGAYEADYMTFGKAADDANKSPVLGLVQEWVKEARFDGDVNRGCAAALTYTLIGERSPTFALRGLDSLLELPPVNPKSQKEPEGIAQDIYEVVVLGYVDLAIYGYYQEVLQHLAQRLELLSYRRLQLTEMKSYQRMHHRLQRQIKLIALLDAFSRIASYSFETAKDGQWVSYNLDKPSPSFISLANKDGRETLLVGILAGSSSRSHISTLLCAALIEKLGDFAFALLWLWANIVLKDQGPSPDRVRKAYVEFVLELGTMVHQWSDHLVALGFPAPSATSTFMRKLEKWQREGQQRNQPIGVLAQEILAQLSF